MSKSAIHLAAQLVLLFVLPGLQNRANAQGGLEFSATFDPIRIYAEPGSVVVRNFQLTVQKGQRGAFFRARPEDWWPSEDGSQSFYRPAGTLRRSCGAWVSLNPVESQVNSGETLDIKVSVAIDPAAVPGGYWCALTVDEIPDPTASLEGVAVLFLASVSVGIYVYVDPIDKAARITSVDLLNDHAEVRVENIGNAPLGVEGRIEFLKPGTEQLIATAQISRRTVVTEPFRSAILRSQLPEPSELPSGEYLVRVILDIGVDAYIGVQNVLEVSREHKRERLTAKN